MESKTQRQAKILLKAYNKFYNKDVNPSRDNLINLTIEIQSMVYILQKFGIELGANGFVRDGYKNLNLPMSMSIQDIVVSSLIENDSSLIDTSIEFNQYTNKNIDIIGKATRFIINQTDNPVDTIRAITSILFTKKYVVPDADNEMIKEYAQCTDSDISNAKKLVYIIKNMKKNIYDEFTIEKIKMIVDSFNDNDSFIKTYAYANN